MQKILIGFHIFISAIRGWSVPVKQIIQYQFLLLGKEIIRYLLVIRIIAKQAAGICQIFIHILKVTQQYFAKIEKLVYGGHSLRIGIVFGILPRHIHLFVSLIEHIHKSQISICRHLKGQTQLAGHGMKQTIDGLIFRQPYGFGRPCPSIVIGLIKVSIKKNAGSFIGEHHRIA